MRKTFTLLAGALVALFVVSPNGTSPTYAGSITVSVQDTDGDGCNDRGEQNAEVRAERAGGRRDPNNPLDFFDTTGDRAVNVRDTQRVAFRFGAVVGQLLYNPLYDRSVIGPDPWDLGPGNGSITLVDLTAALAQHGHVCEGPFTKSVDVTAECNDIVKEEGQPEEEVVLEEGQTHVECFLVRNPDTNEVVDVRKIELTNVGASFEGEEVDAEPQIQSQVPAATSATVWGYYRCTSDKKYESLIFRTDLARVKLILRWRGVIEDSSPYYRVVQFRETWKEVSAVWPWSVSNRNDVIDHFYSSYPWQYKARTWSGFHAKWTIPIPGPDISFTKDMEIHVSTEAWVGGGRGWCRNEGHHT